MEKSALQIRAEKAAARFRDVSRRPVVVEFAGTPKAGKTTTLGQVQAFLRRCGFRVEVVVERASVCPVRDKKHFNFNIWTACTTLAQLLEKTQTPPREGDPDILLLDRGLFDSIVWLKVMESLARINRAEREAAQQFLLVEDWRRRISGVVAMVSDPGDALEREQGHLPVVGSGGSIMNPEVLSKMRKTVDDTVRSHQRDFKVLTVDTSQAPYKNNPRRSSEYIADKLLGWVEEHIEEHVLFLPRERVANFFTGSSTISVEQAQGLRDVFLAEGHYGPRAAIERDQSLVQALPVVVVKNASGSILRLKRREARPDNSLHEKLVIWAGGHVRSEDRTNGDALLHCAAREVQEELRLSVEPEHLHLLGAIYAETSESSRRHVALVFVWQAPSDDVAIALCSDEFFERRGTSLSGRFVPAQVLVDEYGADPKAEPWSVEILRHLVAPGMRASHARIF